MNKVIRKTKDLILSKQTSIFSSALLIAVMITISRIFGFLRYRILAGYFTKEQLDIFFASFRIPDLIFEILITGALTSSFIPIFIKYQKNKEELNQNISSIINLMTLVLFVFISLIFIFAGQIIPFITPGFKEEQIEKVIFYSRLLLLGQLPFLVFGNFLTGIGQANKTFLLSAIAPILYNLAIIASTFFFGASLEFLGPLIGVVFGAVLFFIVQIPLLLTSQFIYKPVLQITKGVREFAILVGPRIVAILATQIDATVDLSLATILGAGSYTVFYLAQHLQLLPVSIIGISFGQASLPYLSEIYQGKRIEEFKKVIIESILSIFFFTIPIAIFFIFARTPLVRLFFGGQKFDWEATVQTAITLSYFALSIPLHSVYYFLTRCYYAFLDSKTPFIVGSISIFFNILLSLYFILFLHLPVWSLAISFSFAILINVVILFVILSRILKNLDYRFLTTESIKILISSFVSSFFAYYLMKVLDGLILDTTRTINVFLLLVAVGSTYLILYLTLAWFFEIKELYLFTKFIIKAKEYKKRVIEIYTKVE